MFLQGKVDAASKWVWESSCSVLAKKVHNDHECCVSAIPLTHNKVCLLSVNNERVKYLLLLDSSYSKHSKDKPNAGFIMLSVPLRYSAYYGNVTSGELRPDINY